MKKVICTICLLMALCLILASDSYAGEKTATGGKGRTFWQKLFNYPAEVAEESASTIADTGKRGTKVVTQEVKRVGEVTSGDFSKTDELITEPITGTAETAVKAVEETVNIPIEAAQNVSEKTETK